MTAVVCETFASGRWRYVADVGPGQPPGSLAWTPAGQPRAVYLFGWLDGQAGVWRAVGGFAVSTDVFRVLDTRLCLVGDLATTTTVELPPDQRGRRIRARLAP